MGLISMFSYSLKKTSKINRISKILGKTYSLSEMKERLLSKNNNEKEIAESELWELCETDPNLKNVLNRYKANRETLKEAYRIITVSGAGQWIKGQYIPVASFAFPATLEYILKNFSKLQKSRNDKMEVSYRLISYFQNGETGFIED